MKNLINKYFGEYKYFLFHIIDLRYSLFENSYSNFHKNKLTFEHI